MTDEDRDHSLGALTQIVLEVQIWTAALKEILISRGLTTDEEFARYVAAAQPPGHKNGTEFTPVDLDEPQK